MWLGNDDGAAMDRVSGGSLPARLWGRVVARVLDGVPPRPLPGGGTAAGTAGGAAGGAAGSADEGVGGLISRVLRALRRNLEGNSPPERARPPVQPDRSER